MRYFLTITTLIIVLVACNSPNNKEIEEVPSYEFLMKTGNDFYSVRNLDSAMVYYNLAEQYYPQKDTIYFKKALVFEKQNNMQASLNSFDKAIAINPQPMYYNNRGMLNAILGNHEASIDDYNKAIETDSTFSIAWFNKSVAYYYNDEVEKACETMKKALELNIEDAEEFLFQYCR